MASRKRTVEIEVVADTKQATASLNRIESTVKKTGDQFSMVGKAMVGVFASGQLINVMGDAIERAERVGDVYALTEQIIQQTGGAARVTAEDVKSLSEELSELTGIDKALIGEGQNVLLTFKNLRNEMGEGNNVFDRASALMLDISTVMGTDAKSAAMQLGKALNDPVSQMGALSRAGLTFNAEQKQQIRTLAESGDLLEAQTIILGELESQLGGTAEAAADASDKIRNLGLEVLERLGESLLPAVENAAASATNFFDAWDSDVNLGWSQRLSAAMQTLLGESSESVAAYIEQKEAANDLADASDDMAAGLTGASHASRGLHPRLAKVTDETEDLAAAAEEGAEATESLADAQLAAIDPAFNLLKKMEGFVTAQQKHNDAVAEFGPDSAQARSALVDLLESTGGLSAAQEKFNNEHGPEAEQALRDLAREAGVYEGDLKNILSYITQIGKVGVTGPSFRPLPAGGRAFHSGGVVPGSPGEEVPAVLMAGETVLPTHRGGGGGGGGTIVIPIYLAGKKIDEVVVPAIERYNRRNGRTF